MSLAVAAALAAIVAYAVVRMLDRDATSPLRDGTHVVPSTEVAENLTQQLTFPLIRRGPDTVRCAGDLRPVRNTAVRCTVRFMGGPERHMTVRVTRVRHDTVTYRRNPLLG
ncbi:DUF4333 domain-containing protein [Streptomyces sp. MST-110588]|uniref:DUF4333 domain-containing protein n=1 Tax=Streptomyces sp. MST-110588 TaxID=2833628 RepID=UPI001F5E17E3|nr:DUF4333 domain-containing protein [Streptomyces sp. MST-110588]